MTQGPPPVIPQPAAPLNYGQNVRSDIYEIASRQRKLMLCILGYIVCGILAVATPSPIKAVFALAMMSCSIAGLVFVFMLAIKLYNTATGIILGILCLIPLLGLFALLAVNGKATKTLRQNGIKVGLLGADMSQVPSSTVY